jgi:hypothetical protein
VLAGPRVAPALIESDPAATRRGARAPMPAPDHGTENGTAQQQQQEQQQQQQEQQQRPVDAC